LRHRIAPKLRFCRGWTVYRVVCGETGCPPAAIPAGGCTLPKQKTKLRLTAEIMPMNTKSKIAPSLGLLLAPLALLAKSPETAYVESYHGRTDIPVPISVVMPEVDTRFAGQQVVLEFVVDTTGKPTLITSGSPAADSELVASVEAAVEQWHFAPALAAGLPVARKVVLPVKIVDRFADATRFALN
jgi:TonB family protein